MSGVSSDMVGFTCKSQISNLESQISNPNLESQISNPRLQITHTCHGQIGFTPEPNSENFSGLGCWALWG